MTLLAELSTESSGPTLLFERFTSKHGGARQRYYACSASRDRKNCSFFQSADEKVSETRAKVREEHNKAQQPWKSHEDFYKRLTATKDLSHQKRRFCQQCSLLLYPSEGEAHRKHRILTELTDDALGLPSHLLLPQENNKTNAQYLFSEKATTFLMSCIENLGFDRVLCVGVPRLHEAIQTNESIGLRSLLLDIDHRYGQFYPPNLFCRYNMFNHHFFEGDQSRDVCREFLHRNGGDGIVVVTDPPFGGRVEILAEVIRRLMDCWKESVNDSNSSSELQVMWIFPYFLEHRIVSCLPSLKMLDYKVEYDNHPLFQCGTKRACKKGSPVRIFTNISPSMVVLPASDGYKFCRECQRYVSAENEHCSVCRQCTSKDGNTYKHCHQCKRCVKPESMLPLSLTSSVAFLSIPATFNDEASPVYVHCQLCQRCELPDHKCNREKVGCHICGSLEHKRRDCPDQFKLGRRPKKRRKEMGTLHF